MHERDITGIGSVRELCWGPGGLAAGGVDTVRLFKTRGHLDLEVSGSPTAFAMNATHLATGTHTGEVRIHDLDGGLLRTETLRTAYRGEIGQLAWSPDASILAVAAANGLTLLGAHGSTLTRSHGQITREIGGIDFVGNMEVDEVKDELPVHAVAFSSNGSRILAADARKVLEWDATGEKPLRELDLGGVRELRIGPQSISAWGFKGVWRLDGALRKVHDGPSCDMGSAAVSTDGSCIAIFSRTGNSDEDPARIEVIDTQGQTRWSTLAHRGYINSLTFGPNDRLLASVGREGRLLLHDLRTGF